LNIGDRLIEPFFPKRQQLDEKIIRLSEERVKSVILRGVFIFLFRFIRINRLLFLARIIFRLITKLNQASNSG